jgi:hypothetical protein
MPAVLIACSHGQSTSNRGESTSESTRLLAQHPARGLKPGALVVTPELAVRAIAIDRRYLVWVDGPLYAENRPTSLRQRDLATGRTITLAHDVDPGFGIASTTHWVVYAVSPAGRTLLVAVRHDGSSRRVLSGSLAAPVAARGERIAWAELRDEGAQRVVVQNMADGNEWTAATMQRCEQHGCYRIDTVALAARGVVFDLGAIGPQPSFVVRRAFSQSRPARVALRNDPQPDLVPFSEGALYYWFSRGWFRWDFGWKRPRRLNLPDEPRQTLLRREGTVSFWLQRSGCSTMLRTHTNGTDAATTLRSVRSLAHAGMDTCVHLNALEWTGRQPVTAWTIIPPTSEERHEDTGLVGVILAERPLR